MSLMISSLIFIKEREDLEGYSFILVIFFGAIMGSFLAMLVYRLPLGVSLTNPKRSFCPNCKTEIKWYENIPIISYIFLQGSCSTCKEKISTIYPFVEFLTLAVTLLIYYKIGLSIEFFFLLSIFYLLILLSFIDLKYKAVPDYLLILLLCMVVLYLSIFDLESFSLLFIFIGGIVLLEIFVTFYIQNIKSKIYKDDTLKEQKALGEGDIPIVGAIGAVLGLQMGIFALFLAAVLAIIPATINKIIHKDIETPFIPFLSAGFFLVFVFDDIILEVFNRIVS